MLGQDWSQNKTTLKCMSHYNRYTSFWKTHHSLWGFMTPPGRCDNIHHDLHQCQAKGLLVGIFFPVENSIVSMRFQIAGRKILSVVCVAPSSSSKYSAFLEKVDQVTSFRGFLGRVPPTDSFMQLGISVWQRYLAGCDCSASWIWTCAVKSAAHSCRAPWAKSHWSNLWLYYKSC